MATTINAKDAVIKVDSTVVGCLQSFDFTIERDMDDSTCSADGDWKSVTPGRMGASGSFNGVYREFTQAEAAANFGYNDVYDLLTEGTKVNIEYGTENTGQRRYSADAYISNLQFSKPETGNITWSSNFTVDGAVTHTTNS